MGNLRSEGETHLTAADRQDLPGVDGRTDQHHQILEQLSGRSRPDD